MRCFFLSLLTSLLLVAATAVPAVAQTKEFVSKDGRFRVLMPGTPTTETHPVTFAGSDASATMTMVSVDLSDDVTYAVMYYDYPPGLATGTPQQALAQARDNSASGKTLVWDKAIHLGRAPGRAFKVVVGDGNVMEARDYLVGRRLYSTVVGATPALYDGLDRKTFLDSFKITK